MKTLFYVPIIHSSTDLGSLAKDVSKRGIMELGEDVWKEHVMTIEGFWDAISDYFNSTNVSGMKIYQDGMVAEGEIGLKIIEEGIKLGSKNYMLLSKLLQRGAVLRKTEDFKLVKEERDRLITMTQAKSITQKLLAFIKYKLTKNMLLHKRDEFIANRIKETLNHVDEGILFIGAYHNIKDRLPHDIQVIEIKSTEKVKKYQHLLPFYRRHRKRFEELGKYLVSKVEI